uniref:Uncharacterized protein n=1 Tax=Arundo donax TaxID=35708 RepID=A0A0A9ADV1_ARUDO
MVKIFPLGRKSCGSRNTSRHPVNSLCEFYHSSYHLQRQGEAGRTQRHREVPEKGRRGGAHRRHDR